jgi:hypothetical protein
MAKFSRLLLVCAIGSGCSSREAPASASLSPAAMAEAPGGPAPAGGASEASAAKSAQSIASAAATSGPAGDPGTEAMSARAVIRNATMQLSDEHPATITEQAAVLARAAGGYLLDGATQTAADTVLSSMVVLRVPEPAFEKTLEQVRRLAKLREESITGEDVTDEFVDTEARLRALRKLELRLMGLLEQSAKLNDLLHVEQEVARVNGEIERFEGRLRYLRERTQMSTITLTVHAPDQPHVPQPESIASRLSNAFHAGIEVAVSVIESGIVVLGFILPASLTFALLAGPVMWMIRRRRSQLAVVASLASTT